MYGTMGEVKIMVSYVENAPVASDFMQTAYSTGKCNLELSIADLIDNSKSAGSSKINFYIKKRSKALFINQ